MTRPWRIGWAMLAANVGLAAPLPFTARTRAEFPLRPGEYEVRVGDGPPQRWTFRPGTHASPSPPDGAERAGGRLETPDHAPATWAAVHYRSSGVLRLILRREERGWVDDRHYELRRRPGGSWASADGPPDTPAGRRITIKRVPPGP